MGSSPDRYEPVFLWIAVAVRAVISTCLDLKAHFLLIQHVFDSAIHHSKCDARRKCSVDVVPCDGRVGRTNVTSSVSEG